MTALLTRFGGFRHAVHVADVNVMHLIGLDTRHTEPTAELRPIFAILYLQVAIALFCGLFWPHARHRVAHLNLIINIISSNN